MAAQEQSGGNSPMPEEGLPTLFGCCVYHHSCSAENRNRHSEVLAPASMRVYHCEATDGVAGNQGRGTTGWHGKLLAYA